MQTYSLRVTKACTARPVNSSAVPITLCSVSQRILVENWGIQDFSVMWKHSRIRDVRCAAPTARGGDCLVEIGIEPNFVTRNSGA